MVYVSFLKLTVVSPTRIDLAWINRVTYVGGTPTITKVERSLDNVVWAPLALLYFAPIAYSDLTCTKNTSYWYRIALYDPIGGWGPYCASVCATTTTPILAQALLDVVTPVEILTAKLNGAPVTLYPVYGLSLVEVVVPTEALAKVSTGLGLFPLIRDLVVPIELLVLHLALKKTLALGDVSTPVEAFPFNYFYHSNVKQLAEGIVTPGETIGFMLWADYLAAGEELLLVARADDHLYLFAPSNPAGSWETKDIDFGLPGTEKTLSEIVFWGKSTVPLAVTVSVSLDGGDTWDWSETVTLDRARSGIVYPWLTGEQFRIRFGAAALQISGFQAAALPRGREGPRP